MPEKRFDFKFEDDEYYAVVIDEEDLGLDVSEFLIYSGNCWAMEDELIPTSVYLDNEEGELMFVVHYQEYDGEGDLWDEKDLTEVPYTQIKYKSFDATKKRC